MMDCACRWFWVMVAGLLMAWLAPDSALAMLHPQQGRFLQRDPLGYVDGMSVYHYLRGRPVDALDPKGLAQCKCGPDVTSGVVDLIQRALQVRTSLQALGPVDSYAWASQVGMNLDWRNITTPDCPSGNACRRTQTLCGECVQDSWIGNFMYGLLLKMVGFSDGTILTGGQYVQGPGPGQSKNEKNVFVDPPWDVAGYKIAWLFLQTLDDPAAPLPLNTTSFCSLMKGSEHWGVSVDVTPGGYHGHQPGGVYPTPSQDGSYRQTCEPCSTQAGRLHGVPGKQGVPGF